MSFMTRWLNLLKKLNVYDISICFHTYNTNLYANPYENRVYYDDNTNVNSLISITIGFI
jgi:hypothetical protein